MRTTLASFIDLLRAFVGHRDEILNFVAQSGVTSYRELADTQRTSTWLNVFKSWSLDVKVVKSHCRSFFRTSQTRLCIAKYPVVCCIGNPLQKLELNSSNRIAVSRPESAASTEVEFEKQRIVSSTT